MGSDDYYVLEADLSSSGGYINFMTVSVPIGNSTKLYIHPLDTSIPQTEETPRQYRGGPA